jgi:mannose-1-phosphate guanylyltransferase
MPVEHEQGSGKRRRPDDPLWIVVLAGGDGRRLEAFIRTALGATRPKQFCRIIGQRSMLQHTWDRARRLAPAHRVVTVITAGQEKFVAAEAAQGIPGRVLVQPANRETGPGLLLPLLWIAHRQPDASLAVFPADHFVWEESRFLAQVAEAVVMSRRKPDRIVLLGMEPEGPETGYGWIEPGVPCHGVLPHQEVFAVAKFWEKPNGDLARRLQTEGCLWNSFVMAGTAHAFLRLVHVHHPDVVETLQAASQWFDTSAERAAVAAAYRRLRPMDFSRDVLEPGRDALMVQAARGITWSDWGEPERSLQTIQQIGRRPNWLAARAAPGAGATSLR